MCLVDQLTPFTCGLACIESVTTDFKVPITQAQLLTRYKAHLINDARDIGDFGAATPNLLQSIWQDLGFKGQWMTDHRKAEVRDALFKNVQANQAVLLFANYNKTGLHCFRFAGLKDDDTIFAMVPTFGLCPSRIEEISIDDLIAWKYSFALLTK